MKKRRIHIMLVGEHPGWEQLLGQIGVSWSYAESLIHKGSNSEDADSKPPSVQGSSSQETATGQHNHDTAGSEITMPCSLMIVTRMLQAGEMENVLPWTHHGMALIDSTGQFQDQMPVRTYLSSIQPQQLSDPWILPVPLEVHQYCLTLPHDSTAGGTLRVLIDRPVAFFGIDPLLTYHQPDMTWQRIFHSSLPTMAERVAKRPSYPLMMLVLQLMIRLHHRIGLPFVHLWWHPKSDRVPFTFRIDTDFTEPGDLLELYDVLQKRGISATWFLHTGALKSLHFLKKLVGQEIAFHCEEHVQFQTADEYRADMEKGLKRLARAGIHANQEGIAFSSDRIDRSVGYAAPYGTWSEAVSDALAGFWDGSLMEEDREANLLANPNSHQPEKKYAKFRYSSEFGYDYDSFPSVPAGSGTLQLPIHPVSFGSLRRFGVRSEQQIEYYMEWLDARERLSLPLHLYFHPGDAPLSRLAELLDKVAESGDGGYEAVTYRDYAALWEKRLSMVSSLNVTLMRSEGAFIGDATHEGEGARAGDATHEGEGVHAGEANAHPEYTLETESMNLPWPMAVYPVNKGAKQEWSFWIHEHEKKRAKPVFHRLFGSDDTPWFRRRAANNTLSWFQFRKYQYLSWLWRKKS